MHPVSTRAMYSLSKICKIRIRCSNMFQYVSLNCIVGEVIYHCVLTNGIPNEKCYHLRCNEEETNC